MRRASVKLSFFAVLGLVGFFAATPALAVSYDTCDNGSCSDDDDSCWYGMEPADGKRALSCTYYEDKAKKPGVTKCIYNVVRSVVTKYVNKDRHNAAHLLRLHFHDCFVNGCDASVLLSAPFGGKKGSAEKDAPPNLTLEGFEVMDEIKEKVDRQCTPLVSCADLLAIGAMVSVNLVGGPNYTLPLGRLDGCDSQKAVPPVHLPSAQATVGSAPNGAPQSLKDNFKHVGLDLADLVALSGAHTLGHAHCPSFKDRIEYGGQVSPEPLDKELKRKLYECCVHNKPYGCNGNIKDSNILKTPEVDLERGTPKQAKTYPPRGGDKLFDNSYYKNVVDKAGLLTSDQSLYTDDRTAELTKKYAEDQGAFFDDFVASMIRMGNILPSNMGVEPGAGVPLCDTDSSPQCLAYKKNKYGVRKGKCTAAGYECKARRRSDRRHHY